MTEEAVEEVVSDCMHHWVIDQPNGPTSEGICKICGMTHVRTSPYYPQSNGKLERYHSTIKSNCIRVNTPLSLSDAQRLITDFVDRYNNSRLHSAIGYITPKDKLEGRAETILAQRNEKLTAAREARKTQRNAS